MGRVGQLLKHLWFDRIVVEWVPHFQNANKAQSHVNCRGLYPRIYLSISLVRWWWCWGWVELGCVSLSQSKNCQFHYDYYYIILSQTAHPWPIFPLLHFRCGPFFIPLVGPMIPVHFPYLICCLWSTSRTGHKERTQFSQNSKSPSHLTITN